MNTCPAPPASPVDARARKHGYAGIRWRRRASAYSGHIHVEHPPRRRPPSTRACTHACICARSGSGERTMAGRAPNARICACACARGAQTGVRVFGSAGMHAHVRRTGGVSRISYIMCVCVTVRQRLGSRVSNRSTTHQYISVVLCTQIRAGAPCTSPSTRCPTPCVSGRRAAAPAPRARQQGRSEQLVSETERNIRGRHGEDNPRARQERTTLQGGRPAPAPTGPASRTGARVYDVGVCVCT